MSALEHIFFVPGCVAGPPCKFELGLPLKAHVRTFCSFASRRQSIVALFSAFRFSLVNRRSFDSSSPSMGDLSPLGEGLRFFLDLESIGVPHSLLSHYVSSRGQHDLSTIFSPILDFPLLEPLPKADR